MKLNKAVLTLPILAITILSSLGCQRFYYQNPTSPSSTTQTPTVTKDKITFQVLGNALSAKIRYSNSVDGLNQTTSTLPFQISINSSTDTAFLFLEATPTGYAGHVTDPFLEVQIFVNGTLFREASIGTIFLETISVSGTYRR